MNFKEAYLEDLGNAFFDLDEFASIHTIDGEECTVVVIDMSCEEARSLYGKSQSVLNPKETAIMRFSYVIYIRDSEVKRKLSINAMINFDGKKYFIQEVTHTEGVYRLVIGGHTV